MCGCVLIAVLPPVAVVAAASGVVPVVRVVAEPDAAPLAGTAEMDTVVEPAEVAHRMSGAFPGPVCENGAVRFANRARNLYKILLYQRSGFHNRDNAWRILLLICLLCCQYIIRKRMNLTPVKRVSV